MKKSKVISIISESAKITYEERCAMRKDLLRWACDAFKNISSGYFIYKSFDDMLKRDRYQYTHAVWICLDVHDIPGEVQ